MDNQHNKIKGYRDLSQQEIDLINRIKIHAEETKSLLNEVSTLREVSHMEMPSESYITKEQLDESKRALCIATEYLQTGQMWFVRAVALPNGF